MTLKSLTVGECMAPSGRAIWATTCVWLRARDYAVLPCEEPGRAA